MTIELREVVQDAIERDLKRFELMGIEPPEQEVEAEERELRETEPQIKKWVNLDHIFSIRFFPDDDTSDMAKLVIAEEDAILITRTLEDIGKLKRYVEANQVR